MNLQLSQPIIIAAPTQRCGTTLLQRALNSTRKAVIYGENFSTIEAYPRLISLWEKDVTTVTQASQEARKRLLAGGFNDEMSALLPDPEGFGRLQRSFFGDLMHFYEADALRMGFPRWGLKHQPRHAGAFMQFCHLNPAAHYLFICRNIFDVARSYKARWSRTSVDDFSDLGRRWSANYQGFRRISGRKVLHIEYDDLTQNPDAWIQKIETACEVSEIDRSVFSKKVNLSGLIDRMTPDENQTSYREPVSLTGEEYDAILSSAGEAARQLGYTIPQRP